MLFYRSYTWFIKFFFEMHDTHMECIGHIQYTIRIDLYMYIVFVFVICRFHGTDFYTHLVNALTDEFQVSMHKHII